MSLKSRAIDLEEDFLDWMTDAENSFWMLTMYPGIGLPLQFARRGYDWYNYGDTMTMQDAQELAKWGLAREAIWYAVYRSSMNISKEGYRAFRARGGVATGQLLAGVAKHSAKGIWRAKKFIGWGAFIGASAWALDQALDMFEHPDWFESPL